MYPTFFVNSAEWKIWKLLAEPFASVEDFWDENMRIFNLLCLEIRN